MDIGRMAAHLGIGMFVGVTGMIMIFAADKHLPKAIARVLAFVLVTFGLLAMGAGIGTWLGI